MRKIPTLFVRNPDDRRYVTDDVTPDCEWVLAGEGIATRKYDGTCVMLDEDGQWWARREVKRDKPRPPNWVAVEADPATGKTVGWEPIAQSPFAKFHAEALTEFEMGSDEWDAGTYELIGPKINGNPDGSPTHRLIPHGITHVPQIFAPADLVREFCADTGAEGIVWHHPDGRMAKLKARDFAPTPPSVAVTRTTNEEASDG